MYHLPLVEPEKRLQLCQKRAGTARGVGREMIAGRKQLGPVEVVKSSLRGATAVTQTCKSKTFSRFGRCLCKRG